MSDQQSTTEAPANEPHGTEQAPESQKPEPTIESLQAEIEELKKHSRKWEDRAKANKEKADQFDALQRERMTDAERAEAERADLEKRVSDAEERASKAEAALARYKIATEFGLSEEDVEVLSSIDDPDTLRTLAQRLADRSGPRPNPSQGKRREDPAPATTGDKFAAAIEGLF